MEDTGFGDHLPCGRGLFAVKTVEDAASAINEIDGNYQVHSEAARDIALSYLDTSVVLPRFLNGVGI